MKTSILSNIWKSIFWKNHMLKKNPHLSHLTFSILDIWNMFDICMQLLKELQLC